MTRGSTEDIVKTSLFVLALVAIAVVCVLRTAGIGDALFDPIAALLDTSSGYEDCYAQHAGCRGG